MLDHSPGSQRGSQVITLTTTWLIGGSAGATALTAAFIDSLSLQGVSRTKPEQPGSLNFKAHVWSFLFVQTHALQPGVWGCPKVNLQTKLKSWCCSHDSSSGKHSFPVLFILPCAFWIAPPCPKLQFTEDSVWNKGRGVQTSQIKRLLSKQTGKKFKRSIDTLSSDSPAPNSALSFWCIMT